MSPGSAPASHGGPEALPRSSVGRLRLRPAAPSHSAQRTIVSWISSPRANRPSERAATSMLLRAPVDDHLGDASARGRGVHDAVTREAGGEEETGVSWDRAEDRVVVRRHLVQARPAASLVDTRRGDGREPCLEGLRKSEDELGIAVGVEARRLVRVRPGDEDALPFPPGRGRPCRRRSSWESRAAGRGPGPSERGADEPVPPARRRRRDARAARTRRRPRSRRRGTRMSSRRSSGGRTRPLSPPPQPPPARTGTRHRRAPPRRRRSRRAGPGR